MNLSTTLASLLCFLSGFVTAQEALEAPIKSGNYDAVRLLLQKNKFNEHDLGYALVLNFFYGSDSVDHGREQIANLLVENGANINEATSIGTPLILAVKSRYHTFAIKLIELGADVNAIKEREQTALMFSCANGDLELTRILIQKGADVNAKARAFAQDNPGAVTPLKIARSGGFTDIANLLIQNGAKD